MEARMVGSPCDYAGLVKLALQSIMYIASSAPTRHRHGVTIDKGHEDFDRVCALHQLLHNLSFLHWCSHFIAENHTIDDDLVHAALLTFATHKMSEDNILSLHHNLCRQAQVLPSHIPATMDEWLASLASDPAQFVRAVDEAAIATKLPWSKAHNHLYALCGA